MLGVDPAQLGLVELCGAAPEVIEVEPFEELCAAKNFVVTVAPAQAREVVHHRVRQVAFVAVLRHGLGAVALAHLLALLVEHGGQVGVHRRFFAERFEDVDLARRVVHVVVTADHVGDGHVDVVHHHAEVVGGCAVGARDHQVVEFVVADLDQALDLVVPGHHTTLRVLEAQHRLHAFRHRRQDLARLGAPGAVVARLFLVGHLALAQRVQLGHAHVAGINMPARHHLGQHRLVAVHALHLVERAFVVVQAQPLHAFDDHVHSGLGRTFEVGVFNAQHENTACGAGEGPRVEGRADVAQMDEAGGRRSEAGANGCCHFRVSRRAAPRETRTPMGGSEYTK
ncbi:hypothetical protein Y695_02907 [Hydrogenophaga sp. T4]|nr:hypothetical protein Y695_02907 [Hydrogenophaga sp. T4]